MLRMWVEFRRKHLRLIYVPIINFLRYPLPSFRTRRYIKKMVKSFIQELKISKASRIRIIYNFADSPHTFGDFMVVVMLCRFLALSGFQVVLTIVDSGRRADWKELSEVAQKKRIVELLDLAKYLLPQEAEVELTNQYRSDPLDISLDSKYFYASAPYFLDLLISKYEWVIPDDFLLAAGTNETSRPYIAWHVRKANYDNRRNFTSSSIKKDFEILQKKFPGFSVMLISDSAGLEEAFLTLTGSRETKTREVGDTQLLAQPIPGFQNAISAVLGSSFFYQRGGGGIVIAPIFSLVPYLNLCFDKSFFHGWRKERAMPWSNGNQLSVHIKRNLQSFSIAKLIKRLKV